MDVCESFTPASITQCTFESAWVAWEKEPLIWGRIPSYCLEERVSQTEFISYIDKILTLVKEHPIILGIGDAVMANNSLERVQWIAKRIEAMEN